MRSEEEKEVKKEVNGNMQTESIDSELLLKFTFLSINCEASLLACDTPETCDAVFELSDRFSVSP